MWDKYIPLIKKLLYSVLDLCKYFSRHETIVGEEVMHIRFAELHRKKLKYDIRQKFFTFSLKTKDDIFKYLFIFLLLGLAVYLPWTSTTMGISDIEVIHQQYAAEYYNYHFHGESDILSNNYFSAHGQLADNLCYIIAQMFRIDDIYNLRHIMSSLFGWLIIITTGFFLTRLFSWRAAFFGALFLAISPRYIGNIMTDLTNTSFAFAFLVSLYQTYLFCHELPVIKWKRILYIILSISLASSIHIGGRFLIGCLFLFAWATFLVNNPIKLINTKQYWAQLLFLTLIMCGIQAIVGLIGYIYLPKGLHLTGVDAFKAIPIMLFDPHPTQQLFDSQIIWSNKPPQNYFIKYLFITIPFVILIGFFLLFGFLRTVIKNMRPLYFGMITFAFIIPLNYAKGNGVNIYGDFALYLFIYPVFILMATAGYEGILRRVDDKYTNLVIGSIICLLSIMPLRHVIFNHPFENVYFNEISGGIHNTYGKYDLDYNFHSNKMVCNWLRENIRKHQLREYKDVDKIIIATNGNTACKHFFEKDTAYIQLEFIPYKERKKHQWDYYIAYSNTISSFELRHLLWPSKDAIKLFSVENKPIAAILYHPRDTIKTDSLSCRINH